MDPRTTTSQKATLPIHLPMHTNYYNTHTYKETYTTTYQGMVHNIRVESFFLTSCFLFVPRWMRLVWLVSWTIHLFLAHNRQYSRSNSMSEYFGSDLAVTFMMFGYVTFVTIKLHPPSSVVRSAIHQAMTHLIFVAKPGKLGGGMWLWGADELVLRELCNEKPILQHFILHVTILETWHNQYWHWTWFHWQGPHVEFANDVVPSHNIYR